MWQRKIIMAVAAWLLASIFTTASATPQTRTALPGHVLPALATAKPLASATPVESLTLRWY